MSHIYTVYIGPYAEWIVPADHHEKAQSPTNSEMFEQLRGHAPCLTGSSDPPVVMIKKKRFLQECWVAHFPRGGSDLAPRQFSWSDSGPDLQITPFSGFDVEGEMAWFRQTFKDSLDKLTRYYGTPPTVKWGVVPML